MRQRIGHESCRRDVGEADPPVLFEVHQRELVIPAERHIGENRRQPGKCEALRRDGCDLGSDHARDRADVGKDIALFERGLDQRIGGRFGFQLEIQQPNRPDDSGNADGWPDEILQA